MDENLRKQLDEYIAETEKCIEICQTKYSHIDGALKLSRKFAAEKKFLLTLSNNKKEIKEVHLKSSNLRHLKAIISQLDKLENVTSVLKIFKDKAQNVLYVDIVCDNGYTWVKVIARNAQSLHLIWAGEGQYGEKNINHSIDEYVKFAQTNAHNYKTPKLLFYFAGGVTKELADYMKTRNVAIIGEVVEISEDTKRKLTCFDEDDSSEEEKESDHEETNIKQETASSLNNLENEVLSNQNVDDEIVNELEDDLANYLLIDEFQNLDKELLNIKKLNLDISTLIALCSEITNGGENYIFKQPFLNKQAEWERATRLLPLLEEFMKGKELFVCKTAYDNFLNIVNTVGGPNEQERAKKLQDRIQIVPDSPSERALKLKESSKIKTRAKIVFGTGDTLQAITMTSNLGFYRAASQQNVKLAVYIHDSPPLTIQRMIKRMNTKK